jgi:methylamine dehydrogenase accessory protein MauD
MVAEVNMLTFIVAVLSVLVFGLLVAFFALARQVGILYERIAPIGALVTDTGPRIGEATPRWTLPSLTGGEVVIGPREGNRSTLVLFVSPTCPICKKLLPITRLVRTAEHAWLDIILASDGDLPQHVAFVKSAKLQSYPYVVSTELGLSYRVARLPYAVLIDSAGVVRAKGLVNSREQLESLFNAHDMKIGSIQQYLNANSTLVKATDGIQIAG